MNQIASPAKVGSQGDPKEFFSDRLEIIFPAKDAYNHTSFFLSSDQQPLMPRPAAGERDPGQIPAAAPSMRQDSQFEPRRFFLTFF